MSTTEKRGSRKLPEAFKDVADRLMAGHSSDESLWFECRYEGITIRLIVTRAEVIGRPGVYTADGKLWVPMAIGGTYDDIRAQEKSLAQTRHQVAKMEQRRVAWIEGEGIDQN